MNTTFLVPESSRRLLEREEGKCLNLSLLLARYIPHEAIQKEYENKIIGKRDSEWLGRVARRFTNDKVKPLVDAGYQRWRAATEGAPVRFTMPAATRLLVGLGGKGALEIGITLQFITGLPVIPGSALKGLARTYGLLTIAAELEPKLPEKDLDALDEALGKGEFKRITNAALLPMAKHFHRAFGSQDAGGICIFYDSVAAGLPPGSLFEADVMTPHFSDYYSEKSRFPSDDQSPIPVTFLTVAPRTTFAFAVGLRRGADAEAAQTAQQAAEWLTAGLQELGIGSKTAAGYGAFGERRDL